MPKINLGRNFSVSCGKKVKISGSPITHECFLTYKADKNLEKGDIVLTAIPYSVYKKLETHRKTHQSFL